jgi:hypothetical protein
MLLSACMGSSEDHGIRGTTAAPAHSLEEEDT